MAVDELLIIGKQIIAYETVDDALVELIEQYVIKFQNWHEQKYRVSSNANEAVLNELAECHSKVLEKALVVKSKMAQNISSFKRRSKGVLAYIDKIPKSLPSRRGKKC